MRLMLILALIIQTQAAAPTYDVTVRLDEVSTGTATFSIDRAGKVSGHMHINTPNVVEAKLAGEVKSGVWTFEFPFTMPNPGCTGIAKGTAQVPPDRNSISGTLSVSGGCTPEPLSGTFTFSKRAG